MKILVTAASVFLLVTDALAKSEDIVSYGARTAQHMAALCQLYAWADADLPVAARDMTKIEESNLRPQLMLFNQCGTVRVEGIRIRESPLWCVHFLQCEKVHVKGLDIRARGFNNDGVDIECSRNVLVEDCHLDQGDDGFVIKSGRDRDGRRQGGERSQLSDDGRKVT